MSRVFSAVILALFTFGISLAQSPIGIGEWRTHLPHKNAFDVTDGGDEIYCTTVSTFFGLDKATGSITIYDKVNGLSESGVSRTAYDKATETLVVAYNNANVDLIKGNQIINLSDIKRKGIIGDNSIYHILIRDSLAYLCTGFGIVVIDLVDVEVKDTYIIGDNGNNSRVNALTADSTYLYAATAQGIKFAQINDPFLSDFQRWLKLGSAEGLPTGEATDIEFYNGSVYAVLKDTLFKKVGGNWGDLYVSQDVEIKDITASGGFLITSEIGTGNGTRVGRFDTMDTYTPMLLNNVLQPQKAIIDDQGEFWIADLYAGLLKANNVFAASTFAIVPNGPATESVSNISIDNNEMWVATGGVGQSFDISNSRRGFYSYINGFWESYDEFNFAGLDTVEDTYSVFVHPSDGKVYFGTFSVGLLEFDKASKTYTVYNAANSSLNGLVGFEIQVNVADVALDRDGNLWVANFAAERPLSVRKTDGSWKSFRPVPVVDGGFISQLEFDDFNQLWGVIGKSNSQGLVVMNFGDNIDDGQESYKIFSTGEGSGNLPTNSVISIAKDLDGEMWVGTNEGIVVFFCPSLVFTDQGCDGQQILVTQDGFAGYLLESERINTIAIDGANRKWIGTNNGVFLLSEDGTEQIAFFNEENSPLLSNNITDIEINHKTGEVFIGTAKGIISYRSDATEGGETHNDVKVFPNPVRSDYQGPIAIKGLVQDADVKITDVNGHLIYQTTALGGQAVWDGRNPDGVRAKTGVYLVFSANDDGTEKFVTKLVMIK